MPALIKGVVQKKRKSKMRVALITGKRFWTPIRKDLGIREFVWVGWDYTKNRPSQILSAEQIKLWLKQPELEEFSVPNDEGFEGDEVENSSDKNLFKQMDKLTDNSEETEPKARTFSNPMNEGLEVKKPEDSEYEVRSFSDPFIEG